MLLYYNISSIVAKYNSTVVASETLRNPLSDPSAEHDIILESYAKISSGLEIPDTNYVAQCNTMPNSSTIANMYMYIRI